MSEAPERIWAWPDDVEDGFMAASRVNEPPTDEYAGGTHIEYIRADLAHAQVAAVKVKPLVWEAEDGNPACQDANGCGKLYRVIVRHDGTAVLRHNASIHDQETYGSEEAAKAAAQTDCECRVFEMLAHAADANALVAAAYKAAEMVVTGHDDYDQNLCCGGQECGCYGGSVHDSIRHHIRALIPADAKATLGDMLKAERAKALKEAEEICTNIIKEYDVMKADGKTYEPLRVQKAAKGMVSLAREDIRALAQEAGE